MGLIKMTNENTEPRKRLLALDTSTAVLGVAVTENGELLHEINASGERNHSVHLLPIIEQALQASGTNVANLGGIAVGVLGILYGNTDRGYGCQNTGLGMECPSSWYFELACCGMGWV